MGGFDDGLIYYKNKQFYSITGGLCIGMYYIIIEAAEQNRREQIALA